MARPKASWMPARPSHRSLAASLLACPVATDVPCLASRPHGTTPAFHPEDRRVEPPEIFAVPRGDRGQRRYTFVMIADGEPVLVM